MVWVDFFMKWDAFMIEVTVTSYCWIFMSCFENILLSNIWNGHCMMENTWHVKVTARMQNYWVSDSFSMQVLCGPFIIFSKWRQNTYCQIRCKAHGLSVYKPMANQNKSKHAAAVTAVRQPPLHPVSLNHSVWCCCRKAGPALMKLYDLHYESPRPGTGRSPRRPVEDG